MHELSVAQNIIEIIQQSVSKQSWNQVRAVHVEIGAMAGIVPDSLKFSFEAITEESAFRGAQLIIECIPFRIHCCSCNADTENEDGFAVCGECGSTKVKIVTGTELQIKNIELEETAEVL